MAKKEDLCKSILVGDKPEIIRLLQQKAPDLVNTLKLLILATI